MSNRFSAITSFFKDGDLWLPKVLSFLRSLSDSVSALISEGLIQSFSLFVAWIFSISIEIHRIELGVLAITNSDHGMAILLALFLPIVLQLIQHMIVMESIETIGEQFVEKESWSLRLFGRGILYRLGISFEMFGYKWIPKKYRASSLKLTRTLIIITIMFLAFIGTAFEQIKEISVNAVGESLKWHESIALILESDLTTIVTWVSILLTVMCAVVFEINISHYVAVRSHDIINKMRQSAMIKTTQRQTSTSATVKTFEELRRNGDGTTSRNNSYMYNYENMNKILDIELIDFGDNEFKFYDSITNKWSHAFQNIRDLQEYIRGVSLRRT